MNRSKLLSITMVILFLIGIVSCNGSVDEKLFEHSYFVQSDGSWKCAISSCGKIHEYTDSPYIATVEDGKISSIVPLDDIYVGDTITYVGNLVRLNDSSTKDIYIRTSEEQSVIIKAENSTVHHYGNSSYTEIVAVADESYHLFGNVEDLVVKKGNIVIENNAKVDDLAIAKDASNTGADITINVENKESVGVFAYYNAQSEKVKVNGLTAKNVEESDVTTVGKVEIDSSLARIDTTLYATVKP